MFIDTDKPNKEYFLLVSSRTFSLHIYKHLKYLDGCKRGVLLYHFPHYFLLRILVTHRSVRTVSLILFLPRPLTFLSTNVELVFCNSDH